jgi:hypothetical protein
MDLKEQCCDSVDWIQLAQCFQLLISCTQIPSKIAEIMRRAPSALKETALEFQK